MKDLIVTLRVFKGKVTFDESGNISSFNQTMKLHFGRLEWSNFLKSARMLGFSKIEVLNCKEYDNDRKLVLVETPESVVSDIKKIFEVPEKELTPEQKRIKELEERLARIELGSNPNKEVSKKEEAPKVEKDDDLEAARDRYKSIFDKKPHHSWSVEVIEEKINEHSENQ